MDTPTIDTTAIIKLIELRKVYGMAETEVVALDCIDLEICPAEFVAIMGPSGSGKSTLMNIVGCLDHPTAGRYFLAGEDVSDLDRNQLAHIRNQKIGFVFQSFNLLARMTALEAVMLPLVYQRENKLSKGERRERGMAALETVGLTDRWHHYPNELSGGQQQRVAIARALINDPVLILADEPTGNLDTKSSYEIMDLLHNLHEKGRTIVMVTHEPDIANQMERIVHIRDGKVDWDRPNDNKALEAKMALRQSLKNVSQGVSGGEA